MYLEQLQDKLGYTFNDPSLLDAALSRGHSGQHESAVQLEHMGDAVVALVVREFLHHTSGTYGYNRTVYDHLVGNHLMALTARRLNLQEHSLVYRGYAYQILGKGIADIFEAVIGAIYQDGGLEEAKAFILRVFPFQAMVVERFQLPYLYKKDMAKRLLNSFSGYQGMLNEAMEVSPYSRSIAYHLAQKEKGSANYSPSMLLFELEMAHQWSALYKKNDVVDQHPSLFNR